MTHPAEHPRIWLEPAGAPDRCWCSENQWGEEGVEYILASQAHSTIAALRAEIEQLRADLRSRADATIRMMKRAETAEAEVKRLTEDNEALRGELQDWQNGHGKSVRAHAEALARIEILEETLRPFSVLELPRLKNAGNAGFYNLRFADIAAARQALSGSKEK